MRNIMLLMKNYLNCYINSFMKKFNKGKYVFGVGIVLCFSLLMIAYLGFSSYTVTKEFINLSPLDYKYAPFAMFSNISSMVLIVLLTVVLKATGSDNASDAELLLSMPFKKKEIITAKSLSLLSVDFALIFTVSYPSIVVYYILVKGTSALILLKGFLLLIVLTLLSTSLAQLLSFILKNIAKKTKVLSLIQTILMIILLGVFLVFNFYVNDVLTKNTTMDINESLNKVLPIKIIFDFLLNNNWLYFIIILLITIVLFILSVMLSATTYGKNNKFVDGKKKIYYKETSIFSNIFKKEASRYFNFPLYIMNTGIGVFLVIGASIYILIQGREFLDLLVYQVLELDGSHTPFVILFLASAILSTVCTTYCSISLEGKTFWILKALPIDEKQVIYGKVMFNLVLSGLGVLVSSFFMCLVLGFEYYLLFVLFQVLVCFFISCLGMYLNLEFPKLEWDNEIVPIKQSMSILIVMALGMIVTILGLVIYLLLVNVIGIVLTMIILFGIMIILNLLINYLLLTRGIKLFKKIN